METVVVIVGAGQDSSNIEFSPTKKGNAFFVGDDIKYEDFLCMVCEDYNMINEMKAAELAYMLPKRILENMTSNTPLMFLSNDRQLANIITLLKTDSMFVYVSLTANKGHPDVNRNQKRVVRENASADFSSFRNVQYETMKPSHEIMNHHSCGRVKSLILVTYSVARRK
ncbi:hypothetical protein N665_0159s0005 [Sinapis alba]|nr:hypothetical protein N665_0159s0005 [Sinapis alba]